MSSVCGGVVVFDYTAWLTQYPEFAAVSQPVAQSYFNIATEGSLVDNLPTSPIQDLVQRSILINLAICHLLSLAGYLDPSRAKIVGRVSAATQGSVSLQLAMDVKGGALAPWWNQTSYGAMFYAMTLPFRTGFYVPPAQPISALPRFGRYGRGW